MGPTVEKDPPVISITALTVTVLPACLQLLACRIDRALCYLAFAFHESPRLIVDSSM